MGTEPSDWYLSRLVMEREGYQDARQSLQDARRSYLEALGAARSHGWSLRALSARLGVSLRQLCRDAAKASQTPL